MDEPFHLYNIPAIDSSLLYFIKGNLLTIFYFRKQIGIHFALSNTARYAYLSLRSLFPGKYRKNRINGRCIFIRNVFYKTLRNVDGTLPASLFSRTKAGLGEYVLRYTFSFTLPRS